MNDEKKTLATLGVDVQLTFTSALYLFLAFTLSTVAFFAARKYIK